MEHIILTERANDMVHIQAEQGYQLILMAIEMPVSEAVIKRADIGHFRAVKL